MKYYRKSPISMTLMVFDNRCCFFFCVLKMSQLSKTLGILWRESVQSLLLCFVLFCFYLFFAHRNMNWVFVYSFETNAEYPVRKDVCVNGRYLLTQISSTNTKQNKKRKNSYSMNHYKRCGLYHVIKLD